MLNLINLPIGALISLFQRLLCLCSTLLAILAEKQRDKDKVTHSERGAWYHPRPCVHNIIPRSVDLLYRSLPKAATKGTVTNKETWQDIEIATQVAPSCKSQTSY